jgi:DNA-binding CsgD family transcriptional regulator
MPDDIPDTFSKEYIEIFNLAKSGEYTYSDIGNIVGRSKSYIHGVLRCYGYHGTDRCKIRNKKLLELWVSGDISLSDLCIRFKLSRNTVKQIINNNGFSIIRTQNSLVRERIISFYETGKYSRADLAKKYGCSVTTIGSIIGNVTRSKVCPLCGERYIGIYNVDGSCKKCSDIKYWERANIYRQCIECGKYFLLKSNLISAQSSTYVGKYCSNRCQHYHRSRIAEMSRRSIRRLSKELIKSGKYADISTVIKYLSIEYNLSVKYIRKIIKASNRFLPPLGWYSDVLVLKMNNWVSPDTRDRLVLDARNYRHRLEKGGD